MTVLLNGLILVIFLALILDLVLGMIRGRTNFAASRWALRTGAHLTGRLLIAIGSRLSRIRI